MKTNEAPEKIYMTPSFGEPDNVLLATFSKSHLNFHRDIEYIRKDIFIEKAYKYFASCISDNSGGYERARIFENFKKYIEENNQWKPSRAQLNAFSAVIKQVDNGTADVLEGLYKKLVEL